VNARTKTFACSGVLGLIGLGLVGAACYQGPPPPMVPGPTVARPSADGAHPAEIASKGKYVALRNAESKIVSFRIAFAGGSADDPPGKEGLTALTASLMAEGGTTDLTYTQLTERLFPSAAEITAHSERDETTFEMQVTARALEQVYPLLRDVLAQPRLDGEGLSRVKAKAVSGLVDELRGANDEQLAKEALQSLLYEGHPYAHPSVGTERGLSAITLADVHAQWKKVFCRERMVLGLAGGFPEGFDRKVAVELLGQLPVCDSARAELPRVKPPPGAPGRTRVLVVDKPSADAAAISIGFPTELTRSSDDFAAVAFFTDYLGLHRQSSGRLFHELRELRGLNYGDYAYPEYFEQAGSGRYPRPNVVRRQQQITIWIRPVKSKNALFALRAALYVYKGLLERGVPNADIERYRTFLTRYIGLEQQTESRRLGYVMDDLAYGLKKPFVDTMRGGWAALDEAKLAAAVARWLAKSDLSIAIVSKDGAALASALVKGDPSVPVYDAPKPPEVVAADKDIGKLPLGLKAEDVRVVPVADLFK
jgi:zinc protease